MKTALKYIVVTALIMISFIACDKDFASLDSDIINNENATNFNVVRETYNAIAFNNKLDPVQTNGLPVSLLGVYKDDVYGTTTASFVTQLGFSVLDPDFGENIQLDSVVLTLPYFSTAIDVDEDGFPIYRLDSVFGNENIRLSLYESNFFLRNFDPNSSFDEDQSYFSNQSASDSENILQSDLEGTPILLEDGTTNIIDEFTPSNEVIRLEDEEGNQNEIVSPSFRVKLDTTYWREKIFDVEGESVLSNSNNFNNYFRGLYFKTEQIGGSNGNLTFFNLNISNANITIYYTQDPFTEGDDREKVTFTLNFSGNRVNFLQNDFNITLQDGNETTGDDNLFIKGGEGSVALIDLFNGDNIDDDNSTDNVFETFKKSFVNVDDNGNFVSQKRLINEANLIFTVDETYNIDNENTRLYLYDTKNNSPLIDYFTDTENSASPLISRISHLGPLESAQDDQGQEIDIYKFNITQHVVNMLTNDSTNVRLGLSLSSNINLESGTAQRNVLTSESEENIPTSSVISPRGTVLIGSTHQNENKRVYLEVYYTEPED